MTSTGDSSPQDLIFSSSYLGCLAQGSFLIGHEGWAFVIDPRRDVDHYLAVRGVCLPKHRLFHLDSGAACDPRLL